MNVSNLANLFQQNSIFQQNKLLGQRLVQPPVNDMLQRLSENLLTAREQGDDFRKRFDVLELSAEAANQKENNAFGDMPDEILEIYLNQYKVAATISQNNEASLIEYRDTLSAFDQTIQEYENMLAGKIELPQMLNAEDVSELLEQTRAARQQFLLEGAKELNRVGSEELALDGKAYQMAVDGKEGGKVDFRWSIDTSAKDIYAEIDRALTSAHKMTSICQEGASRVAAELKHRGQ